MASILQNYLAGQQAGMGLGKNMLAQQQALEQAKREQQVRNILAQSVTPGTPEQVMASTPTDLVSQSSANQVIPATAPTLDMSKATGLLAQAGLGPEAINYQKMFLTAAGQEPSAVKEYQYFVKNVVPQGPHAIAQYLSLKRQGYQLSTVGGVPTMVPTSPDVAPIPLSTLGTELSAVQQKKAAQAIGTAKGGAQVSAEISVGNASLAADKTKSLIDTMLASPGLNQSFGVKSYLPVIRGTDRARFESLKKQFQDTVFLQNRQLLKGGGSITDYEGQKAENAAARMNAAQTAEDFKDALKDYNYWVDKGLELLKRQAKGEFGALPTAKPPSDRKTPPAGPTTQKVGRFEIQVE